VDEALLGADPISPLKPYLGEGSKSLAGRLRAVIEPCHQILPGRGGDYLLHKQADYLAGRASLPFTYIDQLWATT
jgi:hypothetical protein